jgi:2-polyprenyl-3-methyl-5-hydroxy-6-metoxy-1,4-benzoquinol methylase
MSLPKKCPLCRASSQEQKVQTSHVYGGNGEHAIFHCQKCSVRYLFPGLSEEKEIELYAKEFESFMSVRSADNAGWEQPERHVQANQSQIDRRMTYLEGLLPAQGKILEVGCSSGFMLYPLKEKGWDCVGIEPSGVFGDYVNSKGIPCFSSLEDFKATGNHQGTFDVIMHFFVLEHIRDARGFIQAQLELLKPGGFLVFEMPNANDPLSMIYDLDAYERFIWVISHHWYFDKSSLFYLLNGFDLSSEVRLDQRYDLSNHMVWARDGKPGGMERFTAKLGPQIEIAYKKALVDSGYCDTLIGIVRK